MGSTTSLLTDAMTNAIAGLVQAGTYPEVAARASGISPRTFYGWMQRGRIVRDAHPEVEVAELPDASEHPYVVFFDAIVKAEAMCEATLVTHMMRGAGRDDRAAGTMLEARFGDRWGAAGAAGGVLDRPGPAPRPVAPRGRRGAPVSRGWRADLGQARGGSPLAQAATERNRPLSADANARDTSISAPAGAAAPPEPTT